MLECAGCHSLVGESVWAGLCRMCWESLPDEVRLRGWQALCAGRGSYPDRYDRAMRACRRSAGLIWGDLFADSERVESTAAASPALGAGMASGRRPHG